MNFQLKEDTFDDEPDIGRPALTISPLNNRGLSSTQNRLTVGSDSMFRSSNGVPKLEGDMFMKQRNRKKLNDDVISNDD